MARGNHPTGPAGTLVVGQAGRRRLRIRRRPSGETARRNARECVAHRPAGRRPGRRSLGAPGGRRGGVPPRSEEHTSELQSLAYLVCRLLLEKKKKYK